MAETLGVEDVLRRMQELTSDLKTLHTGISNQVFEPGKSLSSNKMLGAAAGSEIILRFQEAVDNLRHALWLYAETAEFTARGDAASQSRLLHRATEILCALSLHPPLPKLNEAPCGNSFVARLLQLMETTVEQKNEEESSPPQT
ncbi:MAG TPA: hypothetical protein VJA94_17740 [Candidatus Angelobacter sp.]